MIANFLKFAMASISGVCSNYAPMVNRNSYFTFGKALQLKAKVFIFLRRVVGLIDPFLL